MVPFAEERGAEFGEDAVAEVGEGRGNDAQDEGEKAECGESLDDFADGGCADEEVFPSVRSALDEYDRFDVGQFGMSLRELLESAALLGAVAHAVLVVGFLDAVDPAIAEGAFPVVKKQKRMPLGSEVFRFW